MRCSPLILAFAMPLPSAIKLYLHDANKKWIYRYELLLLIMIIGQMNNVKLFYPVYCTANLDINAAINILRCVMPNRPATLERAKVKGSRQSTNLVASKCKLTLNL